VGAGAGLARLESPAESGGAASHSTAGVGLLRIGVSYQLPVDGTDARAGIDLVGYLPAIRSRDAEPLAPWALAVATVGVGF
jgi:hypothetical protein